MLLTSGFAIGSRVELLKRITAAFGPKGERKGIPEGTTTIIKGFVRGMPVISVSAIVGKVELTTDVAININKLKLVGAASSSSGGDGAAGVAAAA